MLKNGKVEICGMYKGKWIRVEGTVKEDLRREARVANSFTEEPKVITL